MTRHSILATSIVSVAVLGCDPRVFDDLADDAPVFTHTKPGGLDSQFYGDQIVAPGDRGDNDSTYLVLARNEDGFGRVSVLGGDVEATGIAAADFQVGGALDPFEADLAMAGDPASALVAMGVSVDGARSQVITLNTADLVQSPGFDVGASPVAGVAFGTTSADPMLRGDIAAVGGQTISVIADFGGTPMVHACTHERAAAFRVVAGDFDGTRNGDELAVSIGEADQAGEASQVVIVDGQTVVDGAAAGGMCFDPADPPRLPLVTIDAPGGEPDFGAELVVADFNDNRVPDLVVSAPSALKLYVYLDVDASVGAPTPIEVSDGAESILYGTALAAGDINSDGVPELVVGDPDAEPKGIRDAGVAHIYEFSGGAFDTRHTLHDASPEANQRFGLSVAVVPYGDDDAILIVGGSKPEVFTYFRTPVTGDSDVRVGFLTE